MDKVTLMTNFKAKLFTILCFYNGTVIRRIQTF